MGTTAEKLQAILDAKTAIKTAINKNSASKVGDNLSTYSTAVSGIRSSLVDVIQGKANTVITAEDLKGANVIRDYAFDDCNFLVSISIPGSVTSIGAFAFRSSGLTSVTIGNGVTSIGESAFAACNITSITIPDSVTSIEGYTFYDCNKLKSVTLPDSITSIVDYMFNNCSGLTSITIPNSVTSIGRNAFYNCIKLTSVTIPDRVTSIGRQAFQQCSRLTSITCLAINPPTLSYSNVFSNTNDCPIYVPAESVDSYKSATYWSGYASRIQAIPS